MRLPTAIDSSEDLELRRFIQCIVGAELNPDADQIADALWFAVQVSRFSVPLQSGTTVGAEQVNSNPIVFREELDQFESSLHDNKSEGSLSEAEKIPRSDTGADVSQNNSEERTKQRLETANENNEVSPYETDPTTPLLSRPVSGQDSLPFQTPVGSALPNKKAIARALRPLRRWVESPIIDTLDVEATVERIAQDGLWTPVLRPERVRWLSVSLIVDSSVSVSIWRDTAIALKAMLESQGIFRGVNSWQIETTDGKKVSLRAFLPSTDPDTPRHSPNELFDVSGQQLILVLTDAVAPPWHDGTYLNILQHWGDRHIVAMLHLLPLRLWMGTALCRSTEAFFRSPVKGTPNKRFDQVLSNLIVHGKIAGGLSLPVLQLHPEHMRIFAKMVLGKGWTGGYIFAHNGIVSEQVVELESIDASDALKWFLSVASLGARKLAGFLATCPPFTIQVMRLVQNAMLPDCLQTDLVEFFLSGLLRYLPPDTRDPKTGRISSMHAVMYDFRDGVRDALLETVNPNDALYVMRRVSAYISAQRNVTDDFRAFLIVPSEENISAFRTNKGFAEVAAKVLRRLGGSYATLADQLIVQRRIFVSHAHSDEQFYNDLRARLTSAGISAWTGSRELATGEKLLPDIETAIAEADIFVAVLSFAAVNSVWIKQEVDCALKVKQNRGGNYTIVVLLKGGIKPSALTLWFREEPVTVSIGDEPGSLDRSMPNILAACNLVLPIPPPPPPKLVMPLADLIVELTDPMIYQEEGKTRAQATVTLTYEPPADASRKVESRRYRFVAPLGLIETSELSWYLESYIRWPTGVYKERAERIESLLPEWGKLLYDALHSDAAKEAFGAWEGTGKGIERRLSVKVDRELPDGSQAEAQQVASEAATMLLALPWELLHNGKEYLFEEARGVRVRRQLPGRTQTRIYDTNPPIRVLVVSPRPEKDGVAYLDHRMSARPLVEALAPLGNLAEWTFLTPPTFEKLKEELRRADEANTPYHVVHFDGHGVYDPLNGLGKLVFEHHEDREVIGERRSELIDAERIANAVREYRVPLFFLEACQSALSDKDPTASVAGKLLEGGVASVVAMSHSILVEAGYRFVNAFYEEALQGARVGQAMLAGQRALKADDRRGHTFMGELRLKDWFVPVLYQEERDPQLVQEVPAQIVQEQTARARTLRLGKLPETPPQSFVGRSRELLYAERMLHQREYVVIVGGGGEGKTTLACELARWLVQTGRYARAAFVSFEQATTADSALSILGDQLVVDYQSQAGQGDNRGWLEVERALQEQSTLLVLDNLESVLKPPTGSPGEAAFEPQVLEDILTLCIRLGKIKGTRLLFTSREALPEPFHQNTLVLGRLTLQDAIELVAKTLGEGERMPGTDTEQASREEIEQLVELVNGHARALVLIAREIARTRVQDVSSHLARLLSELERKHPGERERSLLASVRLSLDRLPSEVRERIRPLGVFQGGASLEAIARVLQIRERETILSIGRQLVDVGLAIPQERGFLRFDPAFTTALLSDMEQAEQEDARSVWAETMQEVAHFLEMERFSNPHIALNLVALELPNLLASLDYHANVADASKVVAFAVVVENLADAIGRARAVAQAGRIRTLAIQKLSEWSHVSYLAENATINRLMQAGRTAESTSAAERLLQRCEVAGERAYPEAAYDMAMAYFTLGRAQLTSGNAGGALYLFEEAERRFNHLIQLGHQDRTEHNLLILTQDEYLRLAIQETPVQAERTRAVAKILNELRIASSVSSAQIEKVEFLVAQASDDSPTRMASIARKERADCLFTIGRLSEALHLYELVIQEAEQRNDLREAAVNRGQYGLVLVFLFRYAEALQSYEEARRTFLHLNEPKSVAVTWHQTGIVYRKAGDYNAAERAYQEALQLERLWGNRSDQSNSLLELGNLYYDRMRYEEAVRFFQEASDIYSQLGDGASEGSARSNASLSLLVLQRYEEARGELRRAIECIAPFGQSAQPWKTFDILHDLERALGNTEAAQEARKQATQAYLAYRQDGGENTDQSRSFFEAVTQALAIGQPEALTTELTSLLNAPNTPDRWKTLLRALLRVLDGENGSDLAVDPELDYMDAVELMILPFASDLMHPSSTNVS